MTQHDLADLLAQPAGKEWVARQIDRLLALYFQEDLDPARYAAVLESFAEVLHLQPRWAVAQALREWRAQHNRRPTPSELRILAERSHGDLLTYRRRPPEDDGYVAAGGHHETPEAKARVKAIYEAFKRRVELPPEPETSRPKRLYEPTAEQLEAARAANPIVRAMRAERQRAAE